MRDYFVYILASPSRTLYIGVTRDLERRIWEHKTGCREGFAKKYDVTRLVHMEIFPRIDDAIARERQLKGWHRARKIALTEEQNPRWYDLSHDWFDVAPIGGTGAAAPGDSSLRSA